MHDLRCHRGDLTRPFLAQGTRQVSRVEARTVVRVNEIQSSVFVLNQDLVLMSDVGTDGRDKEGQVVNELRIYHLSHTS